MSHWSLTDYYLFLDSMISIHKYSKQDIDIMIPFERDVMIAIINDRVEKEKSDHPPEGVQWEIHNEAPTD